MVDGLLKLRVPLHIKHMKWLLCVREGNRVEVLVVQQYNSNNIIYVDNAKDKREQEESEETNSIYATVLLDRMGTNVTENET